MKKITKKQNLKIGIGLMIITSIIITLIAFNIDNIYLKSFVGNYEENNYEKLDKENNLGVLNIKDFPKQKDFSDEELIEIDFSEFAEIMNDRNNFDGNYIDNFDTNEVTYEEIKNTRFFKKEDLSGIYLADNNKRLFRSFEVFDKDQEQWRYLYEIIKEDEIFFYEKNEDYYLKIQGLKNQSLGVYYDKKLMNDFFVQHYESMEKYIKGELKREDMPIIAPKDYSVRYVIFKYENKIYKDYRNNINPSLDINKKYNNILNKTNNIFILKAVEIEKIRIVFVLKIWIITLILISYGIIDYLIKQNKKEEEEALKIKEDK